MKLVKVLAWHNGRYGYLVKLAFGISILAVFAFSLDTDRIGEALEYVRAVDLIVLLMLTIARNMVASARFRVLSSVIGKIPFYEIMKQYFVASLFNNFLPTAVGGDGVRFVMVSGTGVSKSEAGVMILLERVIGFYALVTISAASALFWSPPSKILYLVAALFILYSGLIVFVVFGGFGFGRRLRNRHLLTMRAAFSRYKAEYVTLAATFALSLFYQFLSVYISYFVATSIGITLPITVFLTLVPLIWFFTMIPISLGGVGLREVSFAYLFSLVGVANEDSLVVSLGTYLTLVISGFIGGIFILQTRKQR